MKKFWDNASQYLRISIITGILGTLTAIVFLVLSLLSVFEITVPFGIIIGVILISASYFLLDRIGYIEDENQKFKFSIIASVARLFLLVGLAFLEVILEKKLAFRLFNPFAFLGAYLVGSGISLIMMFAEKKKC